MTDFKIHFSVSGWLLLLIIPLLILSFFVFFKVKKQFRRSRNRIVSLVLHCIVLVLCVFVLSGIYFTYDTANERNELVILVDASESDAAYKERVDSYVHDILTENGDLSNVAIVTFGYDQKVALEMGKHDPEKAYEKYLSAPLPDTTATDISGALTFVWDPETKTSGGEGDEIIHYPETAKIFLVSDGLQTDRDAMSVAGRIAMDGIQIDAAHYPAVFQNDARIMSVTFPDRNFSLGETIDFSVELASSLTERARIDLVDRSDFGEKSASRSDINLSLGTQTIAFPYAFSSPGHHELQFVLTIAGDSIAENNVYYTFYDLEEYTSVLVLERYDGESEKFVSEFKKSKGGESAVVDVVNIKSGTVPNKIEALVRYNEVVLVNIAHSDLPAGFENLLESYVKDYGGGMLTVGGLEHDESGNVVMTADGVPKAHAYDQADLNGTKLQEMLPVEAADYSPSTALAIIVDISGSMSYAAGSGLEIAIQGAMDAIDALSTRDQVGILTLEDNYEVDMAMVPMTRKSEILNTIRHLSDRGGSGGTVYAPAIEMACQTLAAIQSAERKHILFLSDADPSDEYEKFNSVMQKFHKNVGINLTVITCKGQYSQASFHYKMMEDFAASNDGHAYVAEIGDVKSFSDILSQDLGAGKEFSGAVPAEYIPKIAQDTPIVDNISQSDLDQITMNGFFTTLAKGYGEVEVSLTAEYVPLYAQWKYGEGTVGSFMCDLSGYWSAQLLGNETGTKLVGNMVSGLIAKVTEIIEGDAFRISLIEDNYRTQVSIYGFDPQAESTSKLIAFVGGPDGEVQKFDLREGSLTGNRFTFENKTQGVYEITVIKVPQTLNLYAQGISSPQDIPPSQIGGTLRAYRAFSYSKEYDPSLAGGKELLIALSTREIEETADPTEKLVYSAEDLLGYFAEVHVVKNPQLFLCIAAVVLMLLDIAARKFKIRWLHEILRTRKQQKTQFGE